MRSEAAGDAKADHGAIALPNGAVGDLFQFAPGGAAHHLHARRGGNSRLESQADKCDDDTALRFDRRVDDPEGVRLRQLPIHLRKYPRQNPTGMPLEASALLRLVPQPRSRPQQRPRRRSRLLSGKSPSTTVNSITIYLRRTANENGLDTRSAWGIAHVFAPKTAWCLEFTGIHLSTWVQFRNKS